MVGRMWGFDHHRVIGILVPGESVHLQVVRSGLKSLEPDHLEVVGAGRSIHLVTVGVVEHQVQVALVVVEHDRGEMNPFGVFG